ncbi:MAG: chromosomal replication initiator protein DnaA [Bacilli bacterium]
MWDNILNDLKEHISSLSFQTWFEETLLYDKQDGIFRVIVPMSIHKKHLEENYKDILENIILKYDSNFREIKYFLKEELEEDIKNKSSTNNFVENDINNKCNSVDNNFDSNLIANYNFETFVVGNSNKFAHAAAVSVAENPGKMYNPLFIYGNSGLGKTHLMHAIGNYIVRNSNKKVLYVTSDQFIQDFIGLNKKDSNGTNFDYVDFFKNKYRNVDVLIIDDIQFLGGATQTQQEFFHTFNSLYNDNKQIIISSDRSPDDLKLLEDRLRTRFCWGLTVDIYPPDIELRKEILRKKIIAGNIEKDIPEEVIEYISANMGSDVRQLEGSITRLLAYSSIMGGSKISLDLAMDALKDYVSKGTYEKDNVHKIQRIVAEYFQITIEDIRSKKRNYKVAFPRQIAMYLCRKYTDESFPKLGIEFGGKDHSTVIHSCDKIERELKVNKELKEIIETLTNEITYCGKK